jgi:hypothetical protein
MSTDSSSPELVAFSGCELVPVTSSAMLVINRHNGRQLMMSPQVVEGLKACTTFRSISDHAQQLAALRPELQGRPELAEQALENLLAEGMLLRASEQAPRLAAAVARPLAPTRVFVITCDRPTAVERLLESMLREGKLGRHEALYLVDDSRREASRAANRELVASFNTRSPTDMHYVGEEAQQALLAGLLARLPDAANGLRFLLDREPWAGYGTYGRSRTLCLLLSVGYRAIVMDDDVLCQALLPPVTESGLGIAGGALRQAAFAGDREALMRSAVPANFDPLSGHASLLGSTVSKAVATFCPEGLDPAALAGTNAGLVSMLEADTPILVTQSGSWGDPGTSSPHWVLMLGPDSLSRLLAVPQGLAQLLENRSNWLGSTRPTLIKMASMSQMTGLDNTALLPPYFPAFRGEDRLFGAMVEAMHHRATALEYGWCVPHLPIEPRQFSVREPIAASGGISMFARYLTDHIDYKDASDPASRLQHLAQDARRIAARSDQDLLMDFRTELARSHAEQLNMIGNQRQATAPLGSEAWNAYLQRAQDEVQAALAQLQSLRNIRGVPADSTDESLLASFRDMANGFAGALEQWVEVREAAPAVVAELQARGQFTP